uniref:Putative genetic modifier n=1 Tax=Hordeum vulgare subsp. vulgare TaxID=112509 RepID=E5F4M8_HORVV|nr:putative genetic modifier [Hordeum vulgare subsp. vulgare]
MVPDEPTSWSLAATRSYDSFVGAHAREEFIALRPRLVEQATVGLHPRLRLGGIKDGRLLCRLLCMGDLKLRLRLARAESDSRRHRIHIAFLVRLHVLHVCVRCLLLLVLREFGDAIQATRVPRPPVGAPTNALGSLDNFVLTVQEWTRFTNERHARQKPVRKKKQQKQGTVSSNRFGVILEWEGVVVEDDDPDLEPRVWYVLSLEEAKSFPPDETLKKIEGMRTDQAISEVLSWSKDRQEIERLAARKEVIYQKLRGTFYQLRPGVLDFLNTLVDSDIPIAVTASRPRMSLEESIKAVGLQGYFDVIVAAEDFHRGKPEGEIFEVAADQLGLEPDVCLVMGSSNLTTQSAHTAGMRCVAVASRHPAYELHAANHVVRWLDQLSVVDLQRLANGEVLGRRGRQSDMDMEIVIEE